MSLRLYYDDPTLLAFDATVRACESAGDRYRLALDRTAFYPTSGGQPHDLGHLRVADRVLSISNVTSDDEEEVWHHVSEAIAPGTLVQRSDRRRAAAGLPPAAFRATHPVGGLRSAALGAHGERASRHRGLHARSAPGSDGRRVSSCRGLRQWRRVGQPARVDPVRGCVGPRERAATAQGHGARGACAADRYRRPRPVRVRWHARLVDRRSRADRDPRDGALSRRHARHFPRGATRARELSRPARHGRRGRAYVVGRCRRRPGCAPASCART